MTCMLLAVLGALYVQHFLQCCKVTIMAANIKVMYKSPEPSNIFHPKDHREYSKHPVQCFDVLSEQLTVRTDQTALEMHYPPLAMHTMTPRLVSANTWNGIQITKPVFVLKGKEKLHLPCNYTITMQWRRASQLEEDLMLYQPVH